MKQVYSTVLMLAIMVAALGFTACSSSSDDDEGGNPSKGQKTLIVDGESFYATNCTAHQTKGNGLYLSIIAATDPDFPVKGHDLSIRISSLSKVSELKEGDVFDIHKFSVREFRRLNEISVNSYDWRELEGNITIKRITSMEMTIQINNLLLEHEISGVQHTISGTAILDSGTYSKGNLLSFEDAIN